MPKALYKYFSFLRRLLLHPGREASEISPFESFQPRSFLIRFGFVTASLSYPVALSDVASSPR